MLMRPMLLLPLLCSGLLLLSGCDDARAPHSTSRLALQGLHSASLSADGRDVVVGSIHHGGSLWTVNPAERLFDWNHKDGAYSSLTSTAFSADGRFVATTDNRTIVLWQRDSGAAVWFWNAPGDIEDIALTRDGGLALLGMRDYTATLFDIQNGGILARLPHDGIVYSVSLSDSGSMAASGSDDLYLRVWNLSSGQQLQQLKQTNQVRTVQLSADGRLLFSSAMNDHGRIWEAVTGTPLAQIGKLRGHYTSARFSQDGRQLLTGSTEGLVQLWDVSSGKLLQQWRAANESRWVGRNVMLEDVAFGAGEWLAVGSSGLLYRLR